MIVGFVLAYRLGRCFCFAEVSTGDPHPTTRYTCREFKSFTQTKKEKSRKNDSFPFWQGQWDSTVCFGFALHTYRSTTQILTNFGTRRPLLSKNNTLYHFLNAKTSRVRIQTLSLNKKITHCRCSKLFFGRGRRIRTLGTWFWRPLLYQLSYTPKFICRIRFLCFKSSNIIHSTFHFVKV